MLSMISNEALMTMQPPLRGDLGFIVPDITGPLGDLPELPVLMGFGDTTGTVIAVGILATGITVAAPLIGAYKGAKHSPGWAAGGAAIGMVAGGLAVSLLVAITGATLFARGAV